MQHWNACRHRVRGNGLGIRNQQNRKHMKKLLIIIAMGTLGLTSCSNQLEKTQARLQAVEADLDQIKDDLDQIKSDVADSKDEFLSGEFYSGMAALDSIEDKVEDVAGNVESASTEVNSINVDLEPEDSGE